MPEVAGGAVHRLAFITAQTAWFQGVWRTHLVLGQSDARVPLNGLNSPRSANTPVVVCLALYAIVQVSGGIGEVNRVQPAVPVTFEAMVV